MEAHFSVRQYDRDKALLLQKELNISHLMARIMVSRGIDTKEKARYFMSSSLERDWVNPYEIEGMEEVVQAIDDALENQEHIVIFGDFDVDGITATAVLTRGLRALGGRVTPFIPRRFDEGYAITPKAYERVKKLNPDMIITVDCGISCADEIAQILDDGIKVVVTDHHEPPEVIPQNVPLIDPRMAPDSPSSVLAGVGVALKVVQAIGSKKGQPYLWHSLIDFATLGTIADLMPLVGENRALVTDGIAAISTSPRPAIAALIEQCGIRSQSITAQDLSFGLIPRINATGRLGDADVGLNLLLCDDPGDAREFAKRLTEINDERKRIEGELTTLAMEQAAKTFHPEDKVLLVAGEGWHEGVKGIVASKLVDRYGVPCILFSIDGDEARGSGRTVGRVNIYEAVSSVSDLIVRFGGHEGAAGITIEASNLDEFRRRLSDYMKTLPEEDLFPAIEADTLVSLSELNLETIEELEKLGPFGQKNPTPVFLAINVCIDNPKLVGMDKNHLSCSLSSGRSSINAIKFNHMPHGQEIGSGQIVAVSFEALIDEWMGRRKVKARLGSIVTNYRCPALREMMSDSAGYLDVLCGSFDDATGKRIKGIDQEEQSEEPYIIKRDCLESMELQELQAHIVQKLLHGGSLHPEQAQAIQSLEEKNPLWSLWQQDEESR